MNDRRDDNECFKRWQWMLQDLTINDARDNNEWCKSLQWMLQETANS